ncbi:MAG: hypothetical protein ABID54_14070, partial [Pseudomonadota bacterium]
YLCAACLPCWHRQARRQVCRIFGVPARDGSKNLYFAAEKGIFHNKLITSMRPSEVLWISY